MQDFQTPAKAPIDFRAPLSRKRKAAMIVQLALTKGGNLPISSLPETLQVELTRELGQLRLVDRQTLESVAEEFLSGLDNVGLALPGGIDNAIGLLGDRLSPTARERALHESSGRKVDPWTSIKALPLDDLFRIMTNEGVEIAAVTLSKLPVAQAAEVLGKLPGERARRISYAVSQTAAITPDAVARIGTALVSEYATPPAKAFDAPPVQRLGAILNSATTSTRTALLDSLGSDDPDFAQEVRKAIFTFPDIPTRLRALDIPAIVRAVDAETMVIALAAARDSDGGEAAAVDYILANMSQRMADGLREEMAEKSKIRQADAERAWGEVVNAIRTKADAGEITLVLPEEDED